MRNFDTSSSTCLWNNCNNNEIYTSVFWKASSAVHSARLVGFERANTIGRSLFLAMSLRISAVNNPGVADAPIKIYDKKK